MSPAGPISPTAQRPRRRRAVAALAVLAALPLAALAGCTAAAAPAPAVAVADAAAPVALPFGPNPSQPAGPPPAVLAKFRWSALASSPLGYRNSPVLTWADGRLLELGGWPKGSTGHSAAAALYDPATGRWKRIADAPPGGSFVGGTTADVWTGRYLAVASGNAEPCPGNPAPAPHCWTGLTLYNPTVNRWTVLALPREFDGLSMGAVVWTGHDLIVGAASLAARKPDVGRLALAAYSPTTRRWQTLTPPLPPGHQPGELNLVSADGRLLLWSLWVDATPSGTWGTDVLAMNARGAWRNVTGRWPQGIQFGLTVTSDGIMATPGGYWCGDLCTGYQTSTAAYFANPATLALTPIPAGPLGQPDSGSLDYVWAGHAIIAVSAIGDLAMYNPATRRWTKLPATPGHPQPPSDSVWTGTELLTLTAAGKLLAFHR